MKDERFYVVLGVAVVLVALTLFTASAVFKQDDTVELCLLYELNEHRLNSYDADRDSASAHRHPFDAPRPPANDLSDTVTLKRSCDAVLADLG